MKTAILSALLALAAPTVTIHPAQLDRGPDVPGPHVEGRVLVDGSMRTTFRAPVVTYLGKAGDRYVVHLMRRDGSHRRALWIRPDETQKVLLRGVDAAGLLLSDDGKDLIATPTVTSRRTVVRVVSARTGHEVAERSFAGSVSLLDADESRVVLGGWGPERTFWWSYRSDTTEPINDRVGYIASIETDRLASYTRDPYLNGCSVLTDLSGARLSRSCSDRVVAISPSGRRVVTVGILSDGPGPAAAHVRRADGGAEVIEYRAPYVFGGISWQDEKTLLLDTFTTRTVTTVRCVLEECERASRTMRSPIS